MQTTCPRCGQSHEALAERQGSKLTCTNCGETFSLSLTVDMRLSEGINTPGWSPSTLCPSDSPRGRPPSDVSKNDKVIPPAMIGRYRIERVLGEGGFGRVYLAHDDQLHRQVAIKVPHLRHVATTKDAAPYLAEAQTLASLDHHHIVPVYDVGSTAEHPCYVVSKYIDGASLERLIRRERLAHSQAVELVATLAEALHYAHKRGLVHRDVKPANILLDREVLLNGVGVPYLADFGLALREDGLGKGSGYAGTPAYMSPEQASGCANRVDGRSDIYGLGVVLYELLTGRRPFQADTVPELLQHILHQLPKPLRQIDDTVPAELERICLKALAKDPGERYLTATDLASDLRKYLSSCGENGAQSRHSVPSRRLAANLRTPHLSCSVALTLSVAFVLVGVGLLTQQLGGPDVVPLARAPQFPTPGPDLAPPAPRFPTPGPDLASPAPQPPAPAQVPADAVVWVGVHLQGIDYPISTGWAVDPKTIVTTAFVVATLSEFYNTGELLFIFCPEDGGKRIEVNSLSIHPQYPRQHDNEDGVDRHDVAVLNLRDPLPQHWARAAAAQGSWTGELSTCGFPMARDESELPKRYQEPLLVESRHFSVHSPFRSAPAGGFEALPLKDTFSGGMEGSPVFNQKAEVMGILSFQGKSWHVIHHSELECLLAPN